MSDTHFASCPRFRGREIVFRRGRIVGEIVPNATGPGGWVTFLDGNPKTQWARSRAEARALFDVDPVVPEGELR